MSTLVGVDTGGTFTDLVTLEDGRLQVAKVLTTWPNPSVGVLVGVRKMRVHEFEMAHGTTVATNAFLERRGARTALVTNRGFRDLLLLGRGTRPHLYALHPRRPAPLIPRDLCFEVSGRTAADGTELEPLQAAEIADLARTLKGRGVETVAVCLLFSFANPEHEREVGRRLGDAGLAVSLSSEISPEYREYERAATTALNAYLQPVLAGYLGDLERDTRAAGGRRLWVVHSAGAVLTAAEASRRAVAAVLSGPAAGVHGAFDVARRAGFDRLLTLDMGGTSTDVSLCPGRVAYLTEGSLEGTPVRQLMVDLHTVGAGGGSLARLDPGGVLRVGPESAGSSPGPAAYGRGDHPTVTDAHLVLGRLPHALLGGEMPLDVERARRAVATLGPLEESAAGILAVAGAHMERALRVISVERGHDPRDFTLVPFGGAGPLQAAELADALGLPRVLVPARPGVLSALGSLVAPWMREFAATVLRPLDAAGDLDARYAEMEEEARRQMGSRLSFERLADLRYRGQGHELTVPRGPRGLAAAFHAAHKRRFGYRREDFPVDLVALRVRASSRRPRPRFEPSEVGPEAPAPVAGTAPMWCGGSWLEARHHDRSGLRPGHVLEGPALVLQYDCTTVLPPGWSARVDRWGNLVMER